MQEAHGYHEDHSLDEEECQQGHPTFINDTDSEIKCSSSSKCAEDTKPSGAAAVPEGQGDIQGDLDRLEAHKSHLKFNKTECKVLHRGQGKPQYQHRLRDEEDESSPDMKDLGILVDEKWNVVPPSPGRSVIQALGVCISWVSKGSASARSSPAPAAPQSHQSALDCSWQLQQQDLSPENDFSFLSNVSSKEY
ncbi:hypothetical protein DUI87_29962 [Hirundo rustica rustica]|uniref:Uncharacterized protein n=1 Tax=Hirundo rustica rustica TaxID=333673 RepID=A0A3M0IWT2_HIRRU|nr:hypothetical protein DUI87_29962 [Hirundo rustica rustica]